jgi:hypothetical protein
MNLIVTPLTRSLLLPKTTSAMKFTKTVVPILSQFEPTNFFNLGCILDIIQQ